jgi:hypothetical protein
MQSLASRDGSYSVSAQACSSTNQRYQKDCLQQVLLFVSGLEKLS